MNESDGVWQADGSWWQTTIDGDEWSIHPLGNRRAMVVTCNAIPLRTRMGRERRFRTMNDALRAIAKESKRAKRALLTTVFAPNAK